MDNQHRWQVLIVEDERLMREYLTWLVDEDAELKLTEACGTVEEGLPALERHHPDLLLLDIKLPDGDGFRLLEHLGDPPIVVFVTAYDEYALKAFEVHALDYLLKPFGRDRFQQTMTRAKAHLKTARRAEWFEHLQSFVDAWQPDFSVDRLAVKTEHRTRLLPLEEIDWIDAEDKWVVIHTKDQTYRSRRSLKELQRLLEPQGFLRISKSILLNASVIHSIEPYFHGDCIVTLQNGDHLKLTRRYKSHVENLLGITL